MKKLFFLCLGMIYCLALHSQNNTYNTSTIYDTDWEYAGPASSIDYYGQPGLGLVDAVTMLPSDNNIKFASSNTSGLYRTSDNGVTWSSVTDDLNLAGMGIKHHI